VERIERHDHSYGRDEQRDLCGSDIAGTITITATNGLQIGTATFGVTDLAGVMTYHNDLSRDGVNAQEYALNTRT